MENYERVMAMLEEENFPDPMKEKLRQLMDDAAREVETRIRKEKERLQLIEQQKRKEEFEKQRDKQIELDEIRTYLVDACIDYLVAVGAIEDTVTEEELSALAEEVTNELKMAEPLFKYGLQLIRDEKKRSKEPQVKVQKITKKPTSVKLTEEDADRIIDEFLDLLQ